MADFEESKTKAVDHLKSLEPDDEFMLITRTGEKDYSYKHYSGERPLEISLITLGSVPISYAHQASDNDVSLHAVADDILKGARLHAQNTDIV